MRWTSSTPASAARSRTASIALAHVGQHMGSGRLMSSKAMVSFIPGKSRAAQEFGVDGVENGTAGWRRRRPSLFTASSGSAT